MNPELPALLAGDASAIREWIESESPFIFGFLATFIGRGFSQEDLEEVVSDSFRAALRNLQRFRGDCKLRTWLIRIGKNKCMNRVDFNRRRRLHVTSSIQQPIDDKHTFEDVMADDSDFVGDIELAEREVEIRAAIARLDAKTQGILHMRGTQHLQYDEIAARLRINVGTVKSRIARARQKVRIEMGEARPPTPSSWCRARRAPRQKRQVPQLKAA